MRYSIRTITAQNAIPLAVSVAEAKKHLRVDVADNDDLIERQIRAAQGHIEKLTGQLLSPRELEMTLDEFPTEAAQAIRIPREPVTAIGSLKHLDSDGNETTVDSADYRWSDVAADLVLPAIGTSWPAALAEPASVRLRFTAGYEEGLLPVSLEAPLLLLIGTLYRFRETVVSGTIINELPGGFRDFIWQHKPAGL